MAPGEAGAVSSPPSIWDQLHSPASPSFECFTGHQGQVWDWHYPWGPLGERRRGGEDKAWSRGMGRGWWEIHGEGRGSTNALLSIPFLWVPEGHLALLGPYLTPRIHQEHQQQNAVTLPFLSLGGFHCFFHRNFFHKPKPHFLPPTTIDLLGSCNLNIRLSKEERDFMVSGLCVGQTGCSLALLHRLGR